MNAIYVILGLFLVHACQGGEPLRGVTDVVAAARSELNALKLVIPKQCRIDGYSQLAETSEIALRSGNGVFHCVAKFVGNVVRISIDIPLAVLRFGFKLFIVILKSVTGVFCFPFGGFSCIGSYIRSMIDSVADLVHSSIIDVWNIVVDIEHLFIDCFRSSELTTAAAQSRVGSIMSQVRKCSKNKLFV